MNEIDLIVAAAESLGWDCRPSSGGREISFERYAPHGKDVVLELELDPESPIANLSTALCDLYRNFDIDEEMELCAPYGKHGTPSARAVLEDIEWEGDAIVDLLEAVSALRTDGAVESPVPAPGLDVPEEER